jgi:hypothetical protein
VPLRGDLEPLGAAGKKERMGKAKGIAIINAVKALRQKKDAARAALPKELHRYLKERVLISSWYPEEDFLAILRALAKVMPDPGTNPYEYMGRLSARADLASVYAHLIRQGDPAATLRRTSVTWGLYHDTGKQEVVESGDNYVVTEISGYGLPSRESCGTVKGWNVELAEQAGGRNVKAIHEECVLDGAKACRFKVSWTS